MTDYRAIFDLVESTLIGVGAQHIPEITIRENLDIFKKVATKLFEDDDYFRILVYVPFYSGFKADTVTRRLPTIRKYFSDYCLVSDYNQRKVNEILADSEMIRHRGKIQACVKNARTFNGVIREYGSFQKYLDSFRPKESFDNLMSLKQDLRIRFAYLGKITAYHFLTDIGMPVLKPDRVIRCIFYRLGLIDSEGVSEDDLLNVVAQGLEFAQATTHPIRYIDIVFVAYSQVRSEDIGIEQGICLSDNPQCTICGVNAYCTYFKHALMR